MMRLFSVLAFALFSLPSQAALLHANEHSFEVEIVQIISKPPQRVYQQMTKGIHQWWSASHSFFGKAENLYLIDDIPGCFCEDDGKGNKVRHLEVVYVEKNKLLRLLGGLGPLQSLPVNGVMEWSLEPSMSGSKLVWRYKVAGIVPGGLKGIAKSVDGVLNQQVQQLIKSLD